MDESILGSWKFRGGPILMIYRSPIDIDQCRLAIISSLWVLVTTFRNKERERKTIWRALLERPIEFYYSIIPNVWNIPIALEVM